MSRPTDAGSWVLRADVVATVLDYGALLLDLDSKYFFQLNPSGWAVTQLFESPTTEAHAVACAHRWGASDEDIPAVRAFVRSLLTFGLVEAAAADTAPDGEAPGEWTTPTLERQPEPLQRVIMSAFDPSIPLAE
jgi:hypothetical protein